jgi:hypothetical protein
MRWTDSMLDRGLRAAGQGLKSLAEAGWSRIATAYLRDGWGPPRAVLALIEFAVFLGSSIVYAVAPHHRDAMRWIVFALVALVIWSSLEQMRWRLKFRESRPSVQAAQQIDLAKLKTLLGEGNAMVAGFPPAEDRKMLWGAPQEFKERFQDWTSEVSEELRPWPERLRHFKGTPGTSMMSTMVGGDIRLVETAEYRVRILAQVVRDLPS